MKKFFSTSLILIFSLLTLRVSAEFTDVSDENEYKDAIDYVESEEIVNGYPDGTYKPEDTINRAEFTKIVIESQFTDEEIDSCIEENTQADWSYVFFSDVPKDEWFGKYICVARTQEIVNGYPDGTYKPEQNISFAEAAKIIINVFGFEGGEDDIWYKPFVEKLGELKAIPLGIESFEHLVTRGEMAEMIYRLRTEITDKESHTYADLSGEENLDDSIVCGGPEDVQCPEEFICNYLGENLYAWGECKAEENASHNPEDPSCNLLPDVGPCKAAITKYYFDVQKDACSEFIWGGCEGIVPFETLETCEQTCTNPEEIEPDSVRCDLIPDAGECEAAITKYYFDGETESCESFAWGGCEGTVPFETFEDCQSICTEELNETPLEPPLKEFDVVAKKWVFEPSEIRVKEGDRVRLNIISVDVTHGFALPDFDINAELMPGENVVIEFVVDQVGEFSFFCSIFCGSGHGGMTGTLIVEE